jgi:hypothetical protein
MENVSCSFCEHWKHAKIKRKKSDEDEIITSGKKKKKGKKKKHFGLIIKKCSAGSKTLEVNVDSPSCKYFHPTPQLYCDQNNCFIDILACLNRRRNPRQLKPYNDCQKCRQFRAIQNIIQAYYLNDTPILINRPKITRREKPKKEKKQKRVIKRREQKRVIKRRDTTELKSTIKRRIKRRESKPKRKIKRRK